MSDEVGNENEIYIHNDFMNERESKTPPQMEEFKGNKVDFEAVEIDWLCLARVIRTTGEYECTRKKKEKRGSSKLELLRNFNIISDRPARISFREKKKLETHSLSSTEL